MGRATQSTASSLPHAMANTRKRSIADSAWTTVAGLRQSRMQPARVSTRPEAEFRLAQQNQTAFQRGQTALEIGNHLLGSDGWQIKREQGIVGHDGVSLSLPGWTGASTPHFYPMTTTCTTSADTHQARRELSGRIKLLGVIVNKVAVMFENCYGIRKMDAEFDFSKKPAQLIYAPNGAMKTSFAKTFKDHSAAEASRDRIYADRPTKRSIIDQDGKEVPANSVFVIEPYDVEYQSGRVSTLLVNNTLKAEYDAILKSIQDKQASLIAKIRTTSGLRKGLEDIISISFTRQPDNLLRALDRVRPEVMDDPFDASLKASNIRRSSMIRWRVFLKTRNPKKHWWITPIHMTSCWKNPDFSGRVYLITIRLEKSQNNLRTMAFSKPNTKSTYIPILKTPRSKPRANLKQ